MINRIREIWKKPARTRNILAFALLYPFLFATLYQGIWILGKLEKAFGYPPLTLVLAMAFLPPLIGLWRLPVNFSPKAIPCLMICAGYMVVMTWPVLFFGFVIGVTFSKAMYGQVVLP